MSLPIGDVSYRTNCCAQCVGGRMPRMLHHIDVWDGLEVPDEFTINVGIFQRCDPIEDSDGNTGLRYYFIKEVHSAD